MPSGADGWSKLPYPVSYPGTFDNGSPEGCVASEWWNMVKPCNMMQHVHTLPYIFHNGERYSGEIPTVPPAAMWLTSKTPALTVFNDFTVRVQFSREFLLCAWQLSRREAWMGMQWIQHTRWLWRMDDNGFCALLLDPSCSCLSIKFSAIDWIQNVWNVLPNLSYLGGCLISGIESWFRLAASCMSDSPDWKPLFCQLVGTCWDIMSIMIRWNSGGIPVPQRSTVVICKHADNIDLYKFCI